MPKPVSAERLEELREMWRIAVHASEPEVRRHYLAMGADDFDVTDCAQNDAEHVRWELGIGAREIDALFGF